MEKYRQTETPDIHNSECEMSVASRDELSAYIDKELPTWQRHLIRRHLKRCEVCSNHVQQLQRADNFLRHAGDVEVSDAFLEGVMARVSATAQHQHSEKPFWSPVVRFVEASFGWARPLSTVTIKLRDNIRTRSPVYVAILTFAVFTMVGATLYAPSGNKLGEQLRELENENLISFEVIQQEPPKRLLTTYLQQK